MGLENYQFLDFQHHTPRFPMLSAMAVFCVFKIRYTNGKSLTSAASCNCSKGHAL